MKQVKYNMLYEIVCDRFKEKKVIFNNDLNVVLGDDIGSNSIGKSSFLMILDFVFGGNDYVLKSTDIQRNIGQHIIKYSFLFDNQRLFFSRDTNETQFVQICNSTYTPTTKIALVDYNKLLFEKYNIRLTNISFRDIVGRYSRIYGKENLNEKRPLDVVRSESSSKAINALLKLFNLYSTISELEKLLAEKENVLKVYTNAQKYKFIKSITKIILNSNNKEIEKLKKEITIFTKELDHNLIEISSLEAEEALKLKYKLSILKRNKSRYKSNLSVINNNLKDSSVITTEDFTGITDYFPSVNLKKIVEIEKFHNEISSVLKIELKKKQNEIEQLLNVAEKEIFEIEEKYKELVTVPNISKSILNKYAELKKRIETLENENLSYETSISLKTAKAETLLRRDKMKAEQLLLLQNRINLKMEEINDFIYSKQKKPPVLSFDKDKYIFETIDDTGTGISYKSMAVYDLSVLELTPLPFLIHDSVVLKQVSDNAIEMILKKYIKSNKQVFIAFDKNSAYSPETQKILQNKKILELSPNGNELFGMSWSNKK